MIARDSLAWLVLLAACGDDGANRLPDAPLTPDGAPVVDAPAGGLVTVTARTKVGAPDPGAVVLFQTATGSIVDQVMADANGVAMGEVPTGGMVTVVQETTLTTIVEAAGGDAITVGNNTSGIAGGATITFPPGPTGTTGYLLHAPCGVGSSTSTTIALTWYAPCAQPAPLVVRARTASVDQGFLVETATFAPGGTTTLTGSWVAPVAIPVTLQNLPATVTLVNAGVGSRVGTSTVYILPTDLPAPSGGVASGSLSVPPAFGDGTEVRYTLSRSFTSYQQVSEAVAGAQTTATFDATHLLPWVENITASMQGLSWTQSSGDSYDGTIVTLDFQYKTATFVAWRVILPSSARQFTLPVLPDGLVDFSQTEAVEAHVELIDSTGFDLADMRAIGGATSFLRDSTMPAVRTVRRSGL